MINKLFPLLLGLLAGFVIIPWVIDRMIMGRPVEMYLDTEYEDYEY